jgi:riboflavin kinase/FMN adenylyltransferase
MISTPERRNELLAERGPDMLVILQFDHELSQWSPERFVTDVLVKGLGARAVFVGENWRFGKGAKGSASLLGELGTELGFDAEPVALEQAAGERVSSSRIRKAVAAGDVRVAGALLGRPFDMDGLVVHGDARGQGLGFPTANVALDPKLVHPARGVYAGRARVGEAWYTAAINVGVNPTFGGDPASTPLKVEAFLLEFSGDLYSRQIRIEFHERLRDEERFGSSEALVAQMHADVEATRALIEDRGA